MTRCIAFVLALVLASLTVSSACLAADPISVRFTLDSGSGGGIVRPIGIEAFGLVAADARYALVESATGAAGVAKEALAG